MIQPHSSQKRVAHHSPAPSLVLVVEDEEEVVVAMEYMLMLEGMKTRVALNGRTALREVNREPIPDLVLLDVMLPDLSGLDVCTKIRETPLTSHVPVIMLTARGGELDRVLGLEVGADDYLVKPFSVRELILRIHAVLRRMRPLRIETNSVRHQVGRLNLDVDAHRIYVDEQELELTHTQFTLLRYMMERPGRALPRGVLLDAVWGIRSDVQTRTVDSHIKQLRRQLGPVGHYIETVRGVGYRFTKSPEFLPE